MACIADANAEIGNGRSDPPARRLGWQIVPLRRRTPEPEDGIDSAKRRTIESYEQVAREYADDTAPDSSGVAEFSGKGLRRLVDAVPAGGTVLEVGSGPGWDADFVESQGVAVRRTEVAEAFIDFQVERGKHVEKLDVTSDELGGPYDAVIALAVLQHVARAHIRSLLHRVAAALQPGGVFLVAIRVGVGEHWEVGDSGNSYFTVLWDESRVPRPARGCRARRRVEPRWWGLRREPLADAPGAQGILRTPQPFAVDLYDHSRAACGGSDFCRLSESSRAPLSTYPSRSVEMLRPLGGHRGSEHHGVANGDLGLPPCLDKRRADPMATSLRDDPDGRCAGRPPTRTAGPRRSRDAGYHARAITLPLRATRARSLAGARPQRGRSHTCRTHAGRQYQTVQGLRLGPTSPRFIAYRVLGGSVVRPTVGDVFSVPTGDDRVGVGQVVATYGEHAY